MKASLPRLPLVLLAATALGWEAPALPPSDKAEPVTKAVRQYALTSANDFPQRDPQDWRLLGSNDDRHTWQSWMFARESSSRNVTSDGYSSSRAAVPLTCIG